MFMYYMSKSNFKFCAAWAQCEMSRPSVEYGESSVAFQASSATAKKKTPNKHLARICRTEKFVVCRLRERLDKRQIIINKYVIDA